MDNSNALAIYDHSAYTPGNASTLQIIDKDTRKVVLNAANNAQSLAKIGDRMLDVIGIIMKPGILRGRNGNPDQPCTDTILVCADGSAYMSKSEGIRKAAENFVNNGVFEDGEPVPMHVYAYDTANGNTIKTLVLD